MHAGPDRMATAAAFDWLDQYGWWSTMLLVVVLFAELADLIG
jgi:hypothetical protein